ncbi:MAG TPA: hypothetical protein VJR29_03250 [bacterium]|nr:hypothetical protein [bacterium]
MRKIPLVLAILLLLGSGVAFVFAFDRYSAAAGYQKKAEETLAKMEQTQDMAKLEELKDEMDIFWLPPLAKAKNDGAMGLGGAVLLLAGSVVLFIKSRRPK